MTRAARSALVLATATNLISYCDRVCISVAAPQLRAEFGLSTNEMGWIFGAFSLAYSLFLAPWGALADRRNAAKLIAAIVTGWSIFTAATASAWSLGSMLVIRFLFGVAESGLSPAVATVLARSVESGRRSSAFGLFVGGGRLGGSIAPPIAALLVVHLGWRGMFLSFAGLGILLPGLWLRLRDDGSHSAAPSHRKEGADWRPLLRSRSLLLLMGVAFAYTVMWQFYPTWFPTYLVEARRFSLLESSWYAGLPFFFGLVATWSGGILTDAVSARLGVRRGRMLVGTGSLLLAAALMAAGMWWPGREVAALLIALAAGAGDILLGVCWAAAVEIGGGAAGAASGLMNAASNAGGFVSPVVMGWAASAAGKWDSVLSLAVLANILAAVLWIALHRNSQPGKGGR